MKRRTSLANRISTHRATDLCLVEKIECTSEGIIYFACASVDTPKKPKINGRTRTNVKVMASLHNRRRVGSPLKQHANESTVTASRVDP
jgi:hypothetical protein